MALPTSTASYSSRSAMVPISRTSTCAVGSTSRSDTRSSVPMNSAISAVAACLLATATSTFMVHRLSPPSVAARGGGRQGRWTRPGQDLGPVRSAAHQGAGEAGGATVALVHLARGVGVHLDAGGLERSPGARRGVGHHHDAGSDGEHVAALVVQLVRVGGDD